MRRQYQADFLVRRALQSFAVIIILGTLLRTFVVSSFVMSGTSMLPSVWPGDFLLAAKWRLHSLNRGEVVALRCPHDKDQVCLKRVVGLPGDRVEFLDGRLTVNGEAASVKMQNDETASESLAGAEWRIWPEATSTDKKSPPVPAVVVPPQHVYLLNDKRDISEDSRSWGPIKTDLIEARILRTWLSLDWFDGTTVRAWPRLRLERMFRSIN